MSTVLQNTSNTNQASNSRLLKNIQNNLPSTNLKKSDVNTVSVKKVIKPVVSTGLIFTPSTTTPVVKAKENEFLIIEDILPNDTSLDGVIADLAETNKNNQVDESLPVESIKLSEILSSSSLASTVEDSSSLSTSTKKQYVYSIETLLSMRPKELGASPAEIEFIVKNQAEIVPLAVSKPTTPHANKSRPSNLNGQTPSRSVPRSTQVFSSPLTSPNFKVAPFSTPVPSSSVQLPSTPTTTIPFQLPTSSALKKLNFNQTPKNNNNANHNSNSAKKPKTIKLNASELVEESKAVVVATPDVNSLPENTTDDSSTQAFKKPRETDPKRLAARQRQIDLGKMTAGYKNFIATVPKSKRKQTDPKVPNIHQVCSKRSWDGQIRKWRRLLHQYDPEAPKIDEEEMKKLVRDEEEIVEEDDDEIIEPSKIIEESN